jgi:hypothetical protein
MVETDVMKGYLLARPRHRSGPARTWRALLERFMPTRIAAARGQAPERIVAERTEQDSR